MQKRVVPSSSLSERSPSVLAIPRFAVFLLGCGAAMVESCDISIEVDRESIAVFFNLANLQASSLSIKSGPCKSDRQV